AAGRGRVSRGARCRHARRGLGAGDSGHHDLRGGHPLRARRARPRGLASSRAAARAAPAGGALRAAAVGPGTDQGAPHGRVRPPRVRVAHGARLRARRASCDGGGGDGADPRAVAGVPRRGRGGVRAPPSVGGRGAGARAGALGRALGSAASTWMGALVAVLLVVVVVLVLVALEVFLGSERELLLVVGELLLLAVLLALLLLLELDAVAAHQLAEAAVLLVLIEERELVVLERVEEVVPRQRLERALAAPARIVDAEDPGVVLVLPGADHPRRVTSPSLHPASDRLVVGGCSRCGHGLHLLLATS